MGNKTSNTLNITVPGDDEEVVDENESTMESADNDPEIVDEDADVSPEDRLPERCIQNSDGSVTLPFKYPVTLQIRKGGKTGKVRERKFTELRLYRLNGADRRVLSTAKEGMLVATAIARMARLSHSVANKLDEMMDLADTNAVGQVLANFSSTGLRTGKHG